MIMIRRYRQSDLDGVARLVRDLFDEFVMPDASPEGVDWWSSHLSPEQPNRERLAQRYARETLSFVATDHGQIVGVVMGTRDELTRLFVRERYHGRGIGRRLMQRYERECLRQGGTRFRIVASLSAVPFYMHMGCKRTTGVRILHGLKVQPMKKVLCQGRSSNE